MGAASKQKVKSAKSIHSRKEKKAAIIIVKDEVNEPELELGYRSRRLLIRSNPNSKLVVATDPEDIVETKMEIVKQEPVYHTDHRAGPPSKKSAKAKAERIVPSMEKTEEDWSWWEEKRSRYTDNQKWTTLQHKGVLLSPPYERLPKKVYLQYEKKPIKLSEAAEEVACFYAAILETDHVKKPVFNRNFFNDWRNGFMTSDEKSLIKKLEYCDFTLIADHLSKQRDIKRNAPKEDKLKLKEQKSKEDELYGTAIVDGRPQKMANFRAEPPGLFMGRGHHPKMGKVKRRIFASDITLNLDKRATIPPVPPGGPPNDTWKAIVHKNDVTWLAAWQDNLQDKPKYVYLNASSSWKGESDLKKYETARLLKSNIARIRKEYTANLKNPNPHIAQKATAIYFIDRLALRAGCEKNTSSEADTVGCCSLRVEHVSLISPNKISLDFLGKDSIRYLNTLDVEDQVYTNVKRFINRKGKKDLLFDALNVTSLNDYLSECMPGLTAKVFRTFNASYTLQKELSSYHTPADLTNIKVKNKNKEIITTPTSIHSEALAIQGYSKANRQVAILCNHQKAVSKTHDESMLKFNEKIKTDSEKLAAFTSELKKIDPSKKEALKKKMLVLSHRIDKNKLLSEERENNKQVALGTSKINYMDPRITIAYSKRVNVPLEKFYGANERSKFAWALSTPASFIW